MTLREDFRNIVAHNYGTVDSETTWEILTEDIPALKEYCVSIIDEDANRNKK